MDGQKSQLKLTRTQSSLLRSSPTFRSSFHSLSSITEGELIAVHQEDDDEEKQRPKKPRRSGSSPRTGLNRFANRVLVMALLLCFTSFSLLFAFFFLRKDGLLPSENLLLALIFVAITLVFVSKNKGLILHILSFIKHSWHQSTKKLCYTRTDSTPVQWYIGDSNGAEDDAQKQSKIIREGVEFYSNGDFYEGEFHNGSCNGSGVYNYFLSGRYEGDWVDGRYDGYGVEGWAKGSRYRGQYRQGLRHGFGVYKFFTGDSYAGEWYNGQSHGVGFQTCADGSCYVGEFKRGVKHGLGCYYFRNGDRYAGEYFGDKVHGFGIYHFVNGHCYEGSWHEGQRQGYGTYTFRNSEAKCGEWDGGSLKNPLLPLNDSVLQAVQAARKAARNAINLPRLDEQVNKAVVAANRAATAARVAAIKAVQNRMDGKFCDSDV
ncbi:phosphatidylinositol 4-phosphate 5-kinase 5-like [Benincasa hispida]|uniref:phosphatidylinositol 4-phosphate 5-kinase 5-like n=1 Tax=Benincasa hispida TaxID=102211 RepID=UPI001901CD33|nr:phosphatidylinositol 4-phosphate 5-kinase 5-like [Benincasa hispida]